MPPSPGRQKPPSSSEASRLLDGCLSIAQSAAAAPWQLGFRYMRRAMDGAAEGALGPWDTKRMLDGVLKGYAQFLVEATTASVFAAEAALDALSQGPATRPGGSELRGEGAAPPALGTAAEVGGKPMLLPVRIADASQAWALYHVPVEVARAQLGDQAKLFSPFTVGGGHVPVAVICTDFRTSDLGTYQEVSVVAFVRPRQEPAAPPGMLFLGLVVNRRFTQDAARRLWNFEKTLAPNLRIAYGAGRTDFAAAPAGRSAAEGFRISFPRFGGLRSTAVPVYLYSTAPSGQGPVAQRTVLSRSGMGEGMQIGGTVELHLGRAGADCLCGAPAPPDAPDCFCLRLRALGLEKIPVAANGWTERMSGEFGPARASPPGGAQPQPFGNTPR